jgi:hypothetical protein
MAERKAYLAEMHTRALALLLPKNGGDVNWADPGDGIILSVADFWEWLDKHVAHERSLVMQHPSQDVTKLLARAVTALETAVGVMGGEADNPEAAAWQIEAEQVITDAKAVLP